MRTKGTGYYSFLTCAQAVSMNVPKTEGLLPWTGILIQDTPRGAGHALYDSDGNVIGINRYAKTHG